MAASLIAITPCKDGSYCCGNGTLADACCRMDVGLFVINGSAMPRKNSAFSSVVSRTASSSSQIQIPLSLTSTAPASSSSSAKENPARETETETGAIVGGTIGGVAVLVLGVLIWKFLDRRKLPPGRNNENETPQKSTSRASSKPFRGVSSTPPRNGENIDGSSDVQEGNGETREIDGAGLILELDSARTWHEMR